ncbi:hypothetical protein BHE74_00049192 [Ensete ventricosum]|uniref:Uncharacterized protein n=1 Tax=Ensete ventricosum TaxID=4639 RepID=A0A426ZH51_ENSVE|nr:hypothetical protein B296_00020247 [Ensete ventricosum]RWW13122.1 hypothetical protein GW17_00023182 [Ensete ventricosum]RWW45007.1 hypothetical protein BHE74_00049192 [Ensete ventricosum]RZS22068.1 hypothetical protein BHM03_00054804 [Ensete ventricosum]
MASSSWCLYAASLARCSPSPSPTRPPSVCPCGCNLLPRPRLPPRSRVRRNAVVSMAPEEEKMTRRSPLDFPIDSFPYMLPEKRAREWWLLVEEERYKGLVGREWERPKPGRRPDIFPQFSPMKTPLPTPLPEDPPEEDEEEEEEKKEEEEEEEEEDPEKPEMSRMQREG